MLHGQAQPISLALVVEYLASQLGMKLDKR
jgi:hypothetical protein